jgi:hypothetical protein
VEKSADMALLLFLQKPVQLGTQESGCVGAPFTEKNGQMIKKII